MPEEWKPIAELNVARIVNEVLREQQGDIAKAVSILVTWAAAMAKRCTPEAQAELAREFIMRGYWVDPNVKDDAALLRVVGG